MEALYVGIVGAPAAAILLAQHRERRRLEAALERAYDQIDGEQERTARAMELLMARSAPSEYGWLATPAAPVDKGQWIHDETGLNAVPWEPAE